MNRSAVVIAMLVAATNVAALMYFGYQVTRTADAALAASARDPVTVVQTDAPAMNLSEINTSLSGVIAGLEVLDANQGRSLDALASAMDTLRSETREAAGRSDEIQAASAMLQACIAGGRKLADVIGRAEGPAPWSDECSRAAKVLLDNL